MNKGKIKPAVKKMFGEELDVLNYVKSEVFEGRRTCLIREAGKYNRAHKVLNDIISRYESFLGADLKPDKDMGVI